MGEEGWNKWHEMNRGREGERSVERADTWSNTTGTEGDFARYRMVQMTSFFGSPKPTATRILQTF